MSFTHPDELHTTFAAAFKAGNVGALVDVYEAGAIQIQPDGTIATGPEALAGVFTRLLAAGLTMQGDPQRALVAGDIALTSTHYEFGTDDPDGSHTVTRVVTAEVSRRQLDGSWRVVIDAPAFA
jgi:ketosteroid isomerase-like protein